MGTLPPEFLWQIVLALVTGGAIYGGIRADIRSIHSKIDGAQDDADEAHRRLDRHLEDGRRR